MRRTILLNFLFVLLTAFAAHQACAQRNGASGQGQHGQGFAGGNRGFSGGGHGFSGGNHEFRGNRGDHDHDRDHGRHDFHHNGAGSPYGWGYPYGYGYGYLPPYDDYMPDESGNNESYQAPPSAYDQQPSQPVQPPPPPVAEKPAHPVVKEYKWPAPSQTASSAPASEPEPQNFAIVLKNGSTLSATMVLASANSLHYVDTEGKLQHIDLAEVDRAATLKLDRARNLNIYLPASQ